MEHIFWGMLCYYGMDSLTELHGNVQQILIKGSKIFHNWKIIWSIEYKQTHTVSRKVYGSTSGYQVSYLGYKKVARRYESCTCRIQAVQESSGSYCGSTRFLPFTKELHCLLPRLYVRILVCASILL